MFTGLKKIRWILFILALPLVSLTGCSTGGSPAGPPAPPAELPAALQFPTSVGIDVSTGLSSAPLSLPAALMVGDRLKDFYGSSKFVSESTSFIDEILKPLHDQGEIPISPAQKTFTGKAADLEVKIDFADFDYDGDGVKEGCSGSTCPFGSTQATCADEFAVSPTLKPICFRVWVRDPKDPSSPGGRYASGVFDIIPLPDNPGAGRFKGVDIRQAAYNSGFVLGFDPCEFTARSAIYDHFDPQDKSSDFFLRTGDSRCLSGGVWLGRAMVNQAGPDATSVKTINSVEGHLRKFIVRWKEDQKLFGASSDGYIFDGATSTFSYGTLYDGACALISTGLVVDADPSDGSPCIDLGNLLDIQSDPVFEAFRSSGIDTSGIDFLPDALDTSPNQLGFEDVFSPDFPRLPTF